MPGLGGCRAARPMCRARMRWWFNPATGLGVTAVLPCPSSGDVPRGVPGAGNVAAVVQGRVRTQPGCGSHSPFHPVLMLRRPQEEASARRSVQK